MLFACCLLVVHFDMARSVMTPAPGETERNDRMMQTVKTVRLDGMGREVPEFHDGVSIADAVATVEAQFPGGLIEARYV